MKKLFSILILVFFTATLAGAASPMFLKDGLVSKGAVSVGDSTAAVSSAVLDVKSTTQGALIPRMTTTQKNAISSPATGLIVYDTTIAGLFQYNGSAWKQISSDGLSPNFAGLTVGSLNGPLRGSSGVIGTGNTNLASEVTGLLPPANGGLGADFSASTGFLYDTAGTISAKTATQATALLDAFAGDSGSGAVKGLVPAASAGDAAGKKYLKADGVWTRGEGWDSNNNFSANNFLFTRAETATAGTTTTLTVASAYEQVFTGSLNQSITMPVAATLAAGQSWLFVNKSSGTLTIQSSGGNTITTVAAGDSKLVSCAMTTGTTASSWDSISFGGGSGGGLSMLASNTSTYGGTNATLSFTGQYAVVIGSGAGNNSMTGDGNTCLGYGACSTITTAASNTYVGASTSPSSASDANSVAIGANSVGATRSTAIGKGATNNNTDAIAVGYGAVTSAVRSVAIGAQAKSTYRSLVLGVGDGSTVDSADGQAIIGSGAYPITDLYFNSAAGTATPSNVSIQPGAAAGADITGADLTIRAGVGTGNGNSGSINIQTAPGGGAGSTPNAYVSQISISPTGWITLGTQYHSASTLMVDAGGTVQTGTCTIAMGCTNATSFTAKSGNVAGLVFYDGTKLTNDSTVTDVGYDTSTHTVKAANLTVATNTTLSNLSASLPVKTDASKVLTTSAIDLASSTEVTGITPYNHGGTGQSSWSLGDLLYASAANTLSKLAIGAEGLVLKVKNGLPAWGTELGVYKSVIEGSFENGANCDTGWTSSAGTDSCDSSSYREGTKSLSISLSAVNGNVLSQSVTPGVVVYPGDLEYSAWVYSTSANVSLCALQAGNIVGTCSAHPGDSAWHKLEITYPAPSSGTIGLLLKTTASTTGTAKIDDAFLGPSRGIGSVSQANFVGSSYFANTSTCNWSRTNTALGAFSTTAACPGPTVEFNSGPGTIQTTDTDLPKVTINNLPPGYYQVVATVDVTGDNASGSSKCIAINDGTTTSGTTCGYTNNAAAVQITAVGYFSYSTTGNRTFELYGSAGANAITIENGSSNRQTNISITRFPTAAEQTVRLSNAADVLGMVFFTGASSCPQGSLAADNSAVSRTTYAALYNRIGTTFGTGDGSTTFNLPDTRGIFVRGSGTSAKLSNANGTAFSGTLGTYQNDKAQGHYHNPLSPSTSFWGAYAGGGTTGASSVNIGSMATTGAAVADGSNGTPRTGTETNPANVAMLGCIYYVSNPVPMVTQSVIAKDNSTGVTVVNTINALTSNTTLDDNYETVYGNTSGGAFTITLPTAVGRQGKKFIIDKGDTSANLLTVATTSSQTIPSGGTTITSFKLHKPGEPKCLQSDGSNWRWCGSEGDERRVRAKINCDGTADKSLQSGNWISSVGNRATQGCSITIVTGIFSASPVCNYDVDGNISNVNGLVLTSSATSVVVYGRKYDDSQYLDHDGYLTCTGPL